MKEIVSSYQFITLDEYYYLDSYRNYNPAAALETVVEKNIKALIIDLKNKKYIIIPTKSANWVHILDITNKKLNSITTGKYSKKYPRSFDDCNDLHNITDHVILDIKDDDMKKFFDVLSQNLRCLVDSDRYNSLKPEVDKVTGKKIAFFNAFYQLNDHTGKYLYYKLNDKFVDMFLNRSIEAGNEITGHDITKYGYNREAIKRKILVNPFDITGVPSSAYSKRRAEICRTLYLDDSDMREAMSIFTNIGIRSRTKNRTDIGDIGDCSYELAKQVQLGHNSNALKIFYQNFKDAFKDEVIQNVEKIVKGEDNDIVTNKQFTYKDGILTLFINKEEIVLDIKNKKVIKSYIGKTLLKWIFTDDFMCYDGLDEFRNTDPKGIKSVKDCILFEKYPIIEKIDKCKLKALSADLSNYLRKVPTGWDPWMGSPIKEEFIEVFLEKVKYKTDSITKLLGLTMSQLKLLDESFEEKKCKQGDYYPGLTFSPKNIFKDCNEAHNSRFNPGTTRLLNFIFMMKKIAEYYKLKVSSLDETRFISLIKFTYAYLNIYNTYRDLRNDTIDLKYKFDDTYMKLLKKFNKFFTGSWDEITVFGDTLRMLQQQHFNMSKVVFSSMKDLTKIHDELVHLCNIENVNNQVRNIQNFQDLLLRNKELLEKRKKLRYKDEFYTIYAPTELGEIIWEGINLSHCVGGYTGGHANGNCTILFLRQNDEPDVSFYTIELSRDFKKVNQIHGRANKWLGNDPDAIPTVAAWAKKNGISIAPSILRSNSQGYNNSGKLVDIPERISVEIKEETKESLEGTPAIEVSKNDTIVERDDVAEDAEIDRDVITITDFDQMLQILDGAM